jgi:hypothetical protein
MCDKGLLKPSVLVSKYEQCPQKRCPYNNTWLKGTKVLSVVMPWPWLIMKFGKDVENRSWRTDYRGRILIHASKKPDPNTIQIMSHYMAMTTETELRKLLNCCGCIIGSVELVDCVQNSKSKWAEAGQWHWILRDPILLENPVPAKGSLGLWEYRG